MPEATPSGIQSLPMYGRATLYSIVDRVTTENLKAVLDAAIPIYKQNAADIEYLWQYMKGRHPIQNRAKVVRPEILNKVTENHAVEIVQFAASYFLGEPLAYVQHGARAGAADQLAQLNDYMYLCDKAASDMDLATWITLCGQGYRIVLPRKEVEQGRESDEAPFLIETLPPQSTFVVYSTAIGHRPLLGVVVKARQTDSGDGAELIYGGYTDEFYFEATDQGVIPGSIRPHSMGCVPIFEYNLNLQKMGVFEPALPLLDALDAVISNRLDSVEQFVQSYFRAINCELDVETFEEFKSKGMIQLKSAQGLPASFDLITQELNQQQVQTLTDYIYDQILVICGVPTTKKGGTSTSDTGAAVFLRDGWTQAEARARTTEMLFRRSERNFLRAVFRMLRDLEPDWTLPLVDVDFKFTRRQTDNLQNKTQALMQMLQAGIDPSIAIAQSGLFNDPTDVAQRSEAYLHKWEPDVEPIAPAEPVAPFVDGEIIAE